MNYSFLAVRTARCGRLLVAGFALILAPQLVSAQSRLSRSNAPGAHAVGFTVVEQYDRSRGYRGDTNPLTGRPDSGERARPIQTIIWYPAQAGTGKPMKAGDYLRLRATSDAFDRKAAERTRLGDQIVSESVFELSQARAQAELTAPMTARSGAAALHGRYPVVIYAPSFGAAAFENADLCEYLASFGYVVIASPSLGHRPGGMTTDLEGAEAQATDIEFLIGYAETLANADSRHVAAMGFSWGGLANVMAAAKDPRIAALVSLDGSIRSWPTIVSQAGYVTPDRVTAPLLYVAAAPKQVEDMASDVNEGTSFLNKVRYGDLYRITIAPYTHMNFAVMMGQRLLPDRYYGDYDARELSIANDWVEIYVRRFLDAYLKNDQAGRAFLDAPAAKTGAPAHLFTVYKRLGQGTPPTRTAFAAELGRRGFENAERVYGEFQKRDPDFKLTEGELTKWGYALLRNGDFDLAVTVLRLNTALYKDSANAWDSLAESLAASGDKPEAIRAYRQSLALDSGNANAALRLEKLGVDP